jgi:hypothetical protein
VLTSRVFRARTKTPFNGLVGHRTTLLFVHIPSPDYPCAANNRASVDHLPAERTFTFLKVILIDESRTSVCLVGPKCRATTFKAAITGQQCSNTRGLVNVLTPGERAGDESRSRDLARGADAA